MDHYLDIELRPDPELAAHQVMSALFAKLHRALVALGADNIAVSFPDVAIKPASMGKRLRLHGERQALSWLMQVEWLAGVRDHVSLGAVLAVPSGAQHRGLRRVQSKSSPARLRRRLMRRHDIDEQQASQRIPDSAVALLELPFIQLGSASTRQNFRLFIAHEPLRQTPVAGTFNAYGISPRATVPWF